MTFYDALYTFILFLLFRAAPVAYGNFQARSHIGAAAAGLHHSQSNGRIQAMSETYTTAHGNARSLTHWVRPGIKPITSWFLVGFVSAASLWDREEKQPAAVIGNGHLSKQHWGHLLRDKELPTPCPRLIASQRWQGLPSMSGDLVSDSWQNKGSK